MKKYFKVSLIYAIAAMAMGVFFREFTKGMKFEGITALSKVHVHLFALGCLVYILIAILSNHLDLKSSKLFKYGEYVYNGGLILTSIMFLVRGIMDVLKSDKMSGMISGFAGVGHIILATGIILILVSFIKLAKTKESK